MSFHSSANIFTKQDSFASRPLTKLLRISHLASHPFAAEGAGFGIRLHDDGVVA